MSSSLCEWETIGQTARELRARQEKALSPTQVGLRIAPTWYAGLGFRLLGARMSNDRSIVGYSVFVDLLNY
jgi:hypothetical protein